MKETANRIKTFGASTIRALATLILSFVITLASVVLLILQILAQPFKKLASICASTAEKYNLVETVHESA